MVDGGHVKVGKTRVLSVLTRAPQNCLHVKGKVVVAAPYLVDQKMSKNERLLSVRKS